MQSLAVSAHKFGVGAVWPPVAWRAVDASRSVLGSGAGYCARSGCPLLALQGRASLAFEGGRHIFGQGQCQQAVLGAKRLESPCGGVSKKSKSIESPTI